MNKSLDLLPPKARRGSKPRCHWITHGEAEVVARRLTRLIEPWGEVAAEDRWMPVGFEQTEEAELHKACRLIGQEHCDRMGEWWFKIRRGKQTGPSFDIASTCMITANGERWPGILLVEAKAHEHELRGEEGGKRLAADASENQRANDRHIREAVKKAAQEFGVRERAAWNLSADVRYQMSNRFATACKLAELGYGVILVYLGFTGAEEMKDKGRPIGSAEEWRRLVEEHSAPLFPADVWGRPTMVHGRPIIPLIRSTRCSFERCTEEIEVECPPPTQANGDWRA